jgi:hypothetical protein
LFIRISRGHCIATAAHATVLNEEIQKFFPFVGTDFSLVTDEEASKFVEPGLQALGFHFFLFVTVRPGQVVGCMASDEG